MTVPVVHFVNDFEGQKKFNGRESLSKQSGTSTCRVEISTDKLIII